ncbi:hypothetical protein IP91_00024 [Pseudoduganella lurida]|uniref:Uncharacterized protein n=1 Tax=Pseudoduganella lurida TaxID=1036180 RepID=A0A562RIP4_9BURK|nr:hypothetical protein [Pseudoduganella lurida]TWI68962.1 hypothetical protein IP91_00024 [Pseudoduganella lurida]
MGAGYWIGRYLLAALPLFAILAAVEWFKGTAGTTEIVTAALWAAAAAAIFTGAAWRRYRKALSCPVCDGVTPRTGKPAGRQRSRG